jgi:hypothetical protein
VIPPPEHVCNKYFRCFAAFTAPATLEAWHGVVLLSNLMLVHVADDKEMEKVMDKWIDQLDSL